MAPGTMEVEKVKKPVIEKQQTNIRTKSMEVDVTSQEVITKRISWYFLFEMFCVMKICLYSDCILLVFLCFLDCSISLLQTR